MRELFNTVNWQEAIGSLQITEVWNLFLTTFDSAIGACMPAYLSSINQEGYLHEREALHLENVKIGCGVSIFKLIIPMTTHSLLREGTT